VALPGMTGVDHIGFTVPDLDEARAFLVDVLGCEYLYSLGPFIHEDSDWMAEHLHALLAQVGHRGVLVVDVEGDVVAYLREQGVQVLGEPTASKGAHEGQRWVYFLAPWGMQFELVSYPDGKAYFRNPEAFA